MNPNDKLDRILDHALSEYRDAEPLAGMEDRILRRIAAQPEQNSRRWAWILATAAAAAVIAVALWLGFPERPQQTGATNVTQPAQQATNDASHVEAPVAPEPHPTGRKAEAGRAGAHPQSARHDARSVQTIAKPALTEFPAPAPMTTEEHALLALARTHPDALLARPDDVDELSIAPIEIKPLASGAGAPQGEQP